MFTDRKRPVRSAFFLGSNRVKFPQRGTLLKRIPTPLHSWDVTPMEAISIQNKLRSQVIIGKLSRKICFVGGCDVAFDKVSDLVYAGIVVLKFPDLVEVDHSIVQTEVLFPYIPGLLSFRESPAILTSWRHLRVIPDILIVDGQGIAHPRRFGIASHLGLLLNIPSIGCAKTLLVGSYEGPKPKFGNYSFLIDKGEIVGAALRTKDNVNPVFVSVGHHVTLEDAIRLIVHCSGGYRIPEPTRRAHMLVNTMRRDQSS